MTALSDALAAAQARAIAALGKQYVAQPPADPGETTTALTAMGCTDLVEQEQLIAAWNVLAAFGSQAPAEQKPSKPERNTATDAQVDLMRKIASERNYDLPDDPKMLTRDQASQVIDLMKAGEYDKAAWAVPF